METKLQIEGVGFIDILVTFEAPVDRSLYDFGAVTLAKDGRNFILDPIISFTNDDATEITIIVGVDADTFPKDETYNYQLTNSDLFDKLDVATLFIGDENWEEEPSAITLFVKFEGGLTKAIDLEIE
jgi:hypothetical protein